MSESSVSDDEAGVEPQGDVNLVSGAHSMATHTFFKNFLQFQV